MSAVPRATTRAPLTTPSRSTAATKQTSRPPAAAISLGEVGPDTGGDALAQVFSSFFFAAGKRTLLRISR